MTINRAIVLTLTLTPAMAACKQEPPSNDVRASGHVEATDVRLAPEVGGRILTLAVKEGDRIEPNALILQLDGRDLELAVERARADKSQADAQLALLEAGSRREDIGQAQAQAQATRDDVSAARAELGSAEADLERFEALLKANAGSRKQRDDAATRRDVARERVQAAESRVRAADQSTARLVSGARPQEIAAARSRVAAAAAQLATVEKSLGDTTLRSPIGGVVTEKLVEVGEMIAPRTPAVVVTDLVAGVGRRLRSRADGAAHPAWTAGDRRDRRRRCRNPGNRELHLAQGRVHAAQRADRGGTLEAGLPRAHHRGQQGRRAQAGHAGRGDHSAAGAAMTGPATARADTIMQFDRVTRRYGQTLAVDDLSFDVARGEMFGLIGPDGAGKTTSIRLLCGLLHADGGSIRVAGHDPVKEHRAITAKVGYLSQRFSLYGDLSIDENISFFAEIHGVANYAARRDRLLEITQLTKFRSRLADQLSGGMKQKLALACTLVHEPDVILLDEPTTGVDPVSRREFWKLLSGFLAGGITILMSTPYLDEAERCTRVALLDRGRLLALDTPGALRRSLPGTLLEVVVPDPRAAKSTLQARGFDSQVFGDRLHVWLRDEQEGTAEQFASETAPAVGATSVRPITPSLEDVYIARLTAALADRSTA